MLCILSRSHPHKPAKPTHSAARASHTPTYPYLSPSALRSTPVLKPVTLKPSLSPSTRHYLNSTEIFPKPRVHHFFFLIDFLKVWRFYHASWTPTQGTSVTQGTRNSGSLSHHVPSHVLSVIESCNGYIIPLTRTHANDIPCAASFQNYIPGKSILWADFFFGCFH